MAAIFLSDADAQAELNSKLKAWLAALALVICGFSLFGPFLDNPFLMDDEIQITTNFLIKDLSNWPRYFTSSTFDSGGAAKMSGIYYKPLLTTYYALAWTIGGSDPFHFRFPMLLAHITSAILFFVFLKRFFLTAPALLAAVLFLVHPINSEVVAYIADAQDTLYMMFGLTALTFVSRTHGVKMVFGVTLALVCALLSKETGALFLAICTLYAWLFDRPKFKTLFALSVVISTAYLATRISVGLTSVDHHTLLIHQASTLERLQTVPAIVWHYLETFFVPIRLATVSDFAVKTLTLSEFWLPLFSSAALIAVLVAATAFGLRSGASKAHASAKSKRLALFAFAILTLWFLLHGNALIALDGTYADRWFYLGSVALLIVVLLIAQPALKNKVSRRVLLVGTVLVAVTFAILTRDRLQDWGNPLDLYRSEIRVRPWNWLMQNNVGVELFRAGQIIEARDYFQRAIDLNPVWDVAWNNLGAVEQRQGHIERALELYGKSASLGAYALAYENYAGLLCQRGPLEACRTFLTERALPIFPYNENLKQIAATVGLR